jgi:hypothetical protein
VSATPPPPPPLTVQQLIDELSAIPDKSQRIAFECCGFCTGSVGSVEVWRDGAIIKCACGQIAA